MRRLESFDWWPDLIEEKDKLSLRELASKYGVTPGAISAALKREGISRRAAPPGPRGSRDGDDSLPPEKGAGSSNGGERRIVRPDRTTETGGRPGSKDDLILQHIDKVSTRPDRDIAEEIGVSVRTLASFRARHKIAPYKGPRTSRKAGGRRSKIDPHRDILGTVPDRVVAEKAGVTLNAVRNYRVKHGIPAAAGPGRPKGSTNRKRLTTNTSGGRSGGSAFMVKFDNDEKRIVIADNLGEAFARASESNLGAVLGAEFIALAI